MAEAKEAKPSTGSIPAINRGHTATCLHTPLNDTYTDSLTIHSHTHIFNSDTLQGGNLKIPSQEIEIHHAHFVMNVPTSLFLQFNTAVRCQLEELCISAQSLPVRTQAERHLQSEDKCEDRTFHRRIQDRCPGHQRLCVELLRVLQEPQGQVELGHCCDSRCSVLNWVMPDSTSKHHSCRPHPR